MDPTELKDPIRAMVHHVEEEFWLRVNVISEQAARLGGPEVRTPSVADQLRQLGWGLSPSETNPLERRR